MTKQTHTGTIGDYTLDVGTDDRGRLVAEVWHTESGKTVAIQEVKSIEEAKRFAQTVAAIQ